MTFFKIKHNLRSLSLGLGLAALAGLAATAASAQNSDEARPNTKVAKAATPAVSAMDIAPSIIATAKINCEPVNARLVGPTDTDGADGKKIKANIYEIACKTGPGFIVTAVSATEIKIPFSCNYLTKIKERDATSIVCTLPENTPEFKWLTPVVQPFLPGCEVTGARVIGSTTVEPLIDRYEVGCAAGVGGIIDYPQFGATAPIEYKNCISLEGTNSACTLTTKAQIIESLKPLAAKANAACQVTDVRFVGVTKENSGYYYEFGCATPPGFIVLANLDESYNRTVPCASAMGLGGCKFTDAGIAAADANAQLSTVLKSAGYPCTVKDYNIIGMQESTKRDYAEFKCDEQPWGLIGFVPQPGSNSMVRVNDCFIDQVSRKACTFVTPDTLMKQIDVLIKVAKPDKGCDVKDVRYIGESGSVDNGVLLELACVNKRGYIVVVSADRKSLTDVIPCTVAKSQRLEEQCTIAGNGTYASAE